MVLCHISTGLKPCSDEIFVLFPVESASICHLCTFVVIYTGICFDKFRIKWTVKPAFDKTMLHMNIHELDLQVFP